VAIPAVQGATDLVDLARFGHTDWSEVKTRTADRSTAQWIHGVAGVMADPVAYQVWFAGGTRGGVYENKDPLIVREDWEIQNGRHRSLAAVSLGEPYLLESGVPQWIPVGVEESYAAIPSATS
jgi:hypothetical protein